MKPEFAVPQDADAPRHPVAGSEARFARSRQMVDCLKSELLYSDKRARDWLFVAIERAVSATQSSAIMVSRLTREAAAAARLEAERSHFTFANWETTAKAVIKAMLCAGVLLTPEGLPILRDLAAHAALVGALTPGFRDTTEQFLIEFLIRRLGDVTTRDHTALAHALFRHFDLRVSMDQFEDRVVVLIAGLAGRVDLAGERYRWREVPSV